MSYCSLFIHFINLKHYVTSWIIELINSSTWKCILFAYPILLIPIMFSLYIVALEKFCFVMHEPSHTGTITVWFEVQYSVYWFVFHSCVCRPFSVFGVCLLKIAFYYPYNKTYYCTYSYFSCNLQSWPIVFTESSYWGEKN